MLCKHGILELKAFYYLEISLYQLQSHSISLRYTKFTHLHKRSHKPSWLGSGPGFGWSHWCMVMYFPVYTHACILLCILLCVYLLLYSPVYRSTPVFSCVYSCILLCILLYSYVYLHTCVYTHASLYICSMYALLLLYTVGTVYRWGSTCNWLLSSHISSFENKKQAHAFNLWLWHWTWTYLIKLSLTWLSRYIHTNYFMIFTLFFHAELVLLDFKLWFYTVCFVLGLQY